MVDQVTAPLPDRGDEDWFPERDALDRQMKARVNELAALVTAGRLSTAALRAELAALAAGLSPEVLSAEFVRAQIEEDGPVKQALSSTIAGAVGGVEEVAVTAKTPALNRIRAGLIARVRRPFRMICLGSSTTQGANASTGTLRYVNLVSAGLQAAFPAGTGSEASIPTVATATRIDAPGVQVFNWGVGGYTSAQYVTPQMLDLIATLQPLVVSHMIGSNDANQGVTGATYEARVRAAIAAIDARYPNEKPVHMLLHSFPRRDVAGLTLWNAYRDALRKIAAEDSSRFVFINLSEAYEETGLPAVDPYNFIGPDLVHGGDTSHALLASMILDTMLPRRIATVGAAISGFDRFNRADGAIGTAETGGAWTTAGTAPTIVGNRLQFTNSSYAYLGLAAANVAVAATFTMPATGEAAPSVYARGTSTTHRLTCGIGTSTDTVTLGLTSPSETTTLATYAVPGGVNAGAIHRIELETYGLNVRGYLDGRLVLTAALTQAQSDLLTGTAAGLRVGGSGFDAVYADDFLVVPQ